MNLETLDIERIVREVVSRLRAEMSEQSSAVLTLDARVVTMNELNGKLNGIQKLQVDAKAILTPSVRDELNDKNIELIRVPR